MKKEISDSITTPKFKGKKRQGYTAIRLTEEALAFQVDNYHRLTGTSSARGKAAGFLFLFGLYLLTTGEQFPINFFLSIALSLLFTVLVYKWPFYFVPIWFFLILMAEVAIITAYSYAYTMTTYFLVDVFAAYLTVFFLYPAFQVDKVKRKKS